jgi:peptide/nickel transport system permease protein
VDEAVAQWRIQHGLDQPIHIQYAMWLRNLVTLEFGESFKDHQPVWSKIRERLPITIKLDALSILLVYTVAIPLGIYSATHPDTFGDRVTTLGAFILFAVPIVWAATMAIVFICGGDFFYLFPPGGLHSLDYSPDWPLWDRVQDQAWYLFLPVLLLSYDGFAGLSRYMRASMLEVLRQDFVQMARAKGLSERTVILKHVLRNSLIPLVTILASVLPGIVGGSVIIETLFSLPGIGQLGYESVLARDYPTVMGLFTISAVLTLIGILISDLLLSVVDPRIAFGRRGQ